MENCEKESVYDDPIVIAEIGCNHRGSLDTAKELVKKAAAFCEVSVVKFQKRNVRELLTPEQYNAPHPNPDNSYGCTYGSHREYLEFSIEQHKELLEYCKEVGVIYSTSVWDNTSAHQIVRLQPELIKIPSAMNTNKQLLEYLCDDYGGKIHISTGMSTDEEIDSCVALVDRKKRGSDMVLYACTSSYPVPFKDVHLLEIPRLKERYASTGCGIGFSGHHLGIAIDIAAYALGARWIERHFTLDRTWKGTDHAASLEPDGLRRLVRDLKATRQAMNRKNGEILDIEMDQRQKLKWKEK